MNIPYKPTLPLKPRPIVIIGAGGIVGDAHLPAYRKAGFTVFGIVNRTVEKARKLAETFGIHKVYGNVADAVKEAPADAVYDLALMPDQYLDVLAQLPDGAPVLIQKPMGDFPEQTLAIYQLCKKKKLIAAINCQLRYAPFTMAARYLIDSGLLGEVYDMEVRLTTYTPWEIFPHVVGHKRLEILYHSVHYIDLIRSFLGEPKGIMAKTLRHPAKQLSSSRSTLLFDYGDTLRAVINTNHDHEFGPLNQESFIKWEGTRGAVKAKMGLLLDYPKGVPDRFEYCLTGEGRTGPEWQTVALEGSWFPDAFVGTMASVMRFAEGSSATLPTGIDDVIRTMAIIESAYEATAHGSIPIRSLIS